MKKREDYLSWDEYFMGIAVLSGQRSKDPSTQVGACIINEDKKIVGAGYNGFPKGCSDEEFPWGRDGGFLETKYPFVMHAEQNAILNSIKNLKNCTIYVGLFPCHECAKSIIQSGITNVVYLSDKYDGTDSNKASKMLLNSAGVKYTKLIPRKMEISISLDENLI
ncbi:deoxycytidylate deaminase [Psychrilyobacter atlanticus]|uniref:deoxycytidylate deaminase n=1 Tax=Psychrilyobacter atlanticus TaxID=271091 RepID=UPI00040651D1|nr:dCMP deaminase family protein [Psychrilyobacter atlanticus]